VLVEVVLETLVGKVDAELLEAVVLEILEPENVEHADGQDLRQAEKKSMVFNNHFKISTGFNYLSYGSHATLQIHFSDSYGSEMF